MHTLSSLKKLLGTTCCIAITVGLLGCEGSNSPEDQANKITEHLKRAEEYQRIGQYRAAIIEMRNAEQIAPGNLETLLAQAELANRLGSPKQTLLLLEDVSHEGKSDITLLKAEALNSSGKFYSAKELVEASAKKSDALQLELARAHLGLQEIGIAKPLMTSLAKSSDTEVASKAKEFLSRIAINSNQLEQANTLIEELLTENPKNITAVQLKAVIAARKNQLDQAEKLLTDALAELPDTDLITPEKRSILQGLSDVLTKQGRSAEALVYTKLLADANPEASGLKQKYDEAVAKLQNNEIEAAEELLLEIYQTTQDDSSGSLLGIVNFLKQDVNAASEFLTTHIDPETASFGALKALIVSQLQLQNSKALLEILGPQERERIQNPELLTLLSIALLSNNEKDEGEKTYQRALAGTKESAELRAMMARYQLSINDTEAAQTELKRALKEFPNDENLQQQLIQVHVARGDHQAAYETALAMTKSSPSSLSYTLLGGATLQQEKFADAAKHFNKALSLDKNNLRAKVGLANAKIGQNQIKEARNIFAEISQEKPDNPIYLLRLLGIDSQLKQRALTSEEVVNSLPSDTERSLRNAVAADYFLKLNDVRNAIVFANKIESNTENRYAARVRQNITVINARNLLLNNEIDDARIAILDGLKTAPNHPVLNEMLIDLEIDTKNFSEAEKLIGRIENSKDLIALATKLKGDLFFAQGEQDKALQAYQDVWAAYKQDNVAWLIFQLLSQKDEQQAGRFLSEWRQTIPNSARALFVEALQLQANDESEKAISAYENSLAIAPSNPIALNNLAWLYSQKKDPKALETASKAYQLSPSNPAIMDTYGWLLSLSGDKKKAVEILSNAAELDPENEEIKEHLEKAKKAN